MEISCEASSGWHLDYYGRPVLEVCGAPAAEYRDVGFLWPVKLCDEHWDAHLRRREQARRDLGVTGTM